MFSLKSFLFFILGILITIFSFVAYKKISSYIHYEDEKKVEQDLLLSPLEFAQKIYSAKGMNIKLPSKNSKETYTNSETAIKTTIGVYNQKSTCFIDVSSNANFNSKNAGKPSYVRIVISDPTSFASRNECVKLTLENILPTVLYGGYASIVKSKIYEEGTLNKEFSIADLESYAKTLQPILFDGGFLFESLNVGLLSTPSVFEIHITDCSNVACGE